VINKVFAVKPNGTKRWDVSFTDGITSSPAIGVDGAVYFGCYDGNVYALNPGDGSQKWAFTVGDIIDSSPAIGADGTIYIGANNGKVFAIK
jgi:outer membrane protein assembly factor BamB